VRRSLERVAVQRALQLCHILTIKGREYRQCLPASAACQDDKVYNESDAQKAIDILKDQDGEKNSVEIAFRIARMAQAILRARKR